MSAALAMGDGGCDTYYSAQTEKDTREYIDYIKWWVKKLSVVAQEVDGSQFLDPGDTDAEGVWAVRFASGHKVVTLTSNPRSIHGKQGRAVLDEAARYDQVEEFLEAARPLRMLGGQVAMISTESHVETIFHKMRIGVRDKTDKQWKRWSYHETFFDQALREGFYRFNVMPHMGLDSDDWTPELEAEYRQEIIEDLGEDADCQLFGIPRGAGEVYFARTTVESCMRSKYRVLRWRPPTGWSGLSPDEQLEKMAAWVATELATALQHLDQTLPHALGADFGRSIDLTCIAATTIDRQLRRVVPLVVELRDCPFDCQELVYSAMMGGFKRPGPALIDAGANGAQMAEAMARRYNATQVRIGASAPRPPEKVLKDTSRVNYSEMFPDLRARFEARTLFVPADSQLLDDFGVIRLVKGYPRVPEKRQKTTEGTRHADGAVAIALGVLAARHLSPSKSKGLSPSQMGRADEKRARRDDDGRKRAKSREQMLRGKWSDA